MKTKDVLVSLLAILGIALVTFGIVKLLGGSKTKEQQPTGYDRDGNPIYGEEEVYIPKYLTTQEALEIANDLYKKAEIIMYDPLSHSEYTFEDSDLEGYSTKITNFSVVTSSVFLNIRDAIKKEYKVLENGTVYLNNNLTPKDPAYLKTELQLKENNEDKIVFNAVSSYCISNGKQCDENELLSKGTEKMEDFAIVKNNNMWKVSTFTLPY